MPVSRLPLNLNEEKGLLRAPSDTPYERSPYVSYVCILWNNSELQDALEQKQKTRTRVWMWGVDQVMVHPGCREEQSLPGA